MEIFDLLTREHRVILALFDRLALTAGEARSLRHGLFRRLREELKEHAQAEAAVFYEALLQSGEDLRDLIHDAIDDHADLDGLMEALEDEGIDEPGWLAKLALVRSLLEEHVSEEEDVLFAIAAARFRPDAAETLADQLQMQQRRTAIARVAGCSSDYEM